MSGIQIILVVMMLIVCGFAFESQYKDFEGYPAFWRYGAHRTLQQALRKSTVNTNPAKNVILFVGDGMGITTMTAGRIMKGQKMGFAGEESETWMDSFPYVGLSKIYTINGQTPDSAGTATALLTGVKSKSKMLGLNGHAKYENCASSKGNSITTILEHAADMNKYTGIVTTAHVTHATPASSYAHSASRGWTTDGDLPPKAKEDGCLDIASQLIEKGRKINVLLGGGRVFMRPKGYDDEEYGKSYKKAEEGRTDDRNLIEEWKKLCPSDKARYVWNQEGFDKANPKNVDYLLGLFEPTDMRYEHDKSNDVSGEPSIAEMTAKAIQILKKNPKGYFLLVESGRIDHAHHETKANAALSEFAAFDEAVGMADRMTSTKDTLIIVTADHGHVFTMGGSSVRGNPVNGFAEDHENPTTAKDGKPYTSISYGNGAQRQGHKNTRRDLTGDDIGQMDFSYPSAIPLSAESHSAADVAVLARGPMSHLFTGIYEQNFIGYAMMYASCLGPDKRHCKKQNRVRSWDCADYSEAQILKRKLVAAKYGRTLRLSTLIPWWCRDGIRPKWTLITPTEAPKATNKPTNEQEWMDNEEENTRRRPSSSAFPDIKQPSARPVFAKPAQIKVKEIKKRVTPGSTRQTLAANPLLPTKLSNNRGSRRRSSTVPTTANPRSESTYRSNTADEGKTTTKSPVPNAPSPKPAVRRPRPPTARPRMRRYTTAPRRQFHSTIPRNSPTRPARAPTKRSRPTTATTRYSNGDRPIHRQTTRPQTRNTARPQNARTRLARTNKITTTSGETKPPSRQGTAGASKFKPRPRSTKQTVTKQRGDLRNKDPTSRPVNQRRQGNAQVKTTVRTPRRNPQGQYVRPRGAQRHSSKPVATTSRTPGKQKGKPGERNSNGNKQAYSNKASKPGQIKKRLPTPRNHQISRRDLTTESDEETDTLPVTASPHEIDLSETTTLFQSARITAKQITQHPRERFLDGIAYAIRRHLQYMTIYSDDGSPVDLDLSIRVTPQIGNPDGNDLENVSSEDDLEATVVCMKWNSSSGLVHLGSNISEYSFRYKEREKSPEKQLNTVSSAGGSDSMIATILLALLAVLLFVLCLALLFQLRKKHNMLNELMDENEKRRLREMQNMRLEDVDESDLVREELRGTNGNNNNYFCNMEKNKVLTVSQTIVDERVQTFLKPRKVSASS